MATVIEPVTQPTWTSDSTKKTHELRTGDTVTTPDGSRTGMVRNTYPGGLFGKTEGVTTVKFFAVSVRLTGPTGRPGGSSYVFDVPDDSDWALWRESA